MKLLLDTHTFLWWDSEPSRLPASVLALCQDTHNSLVLSVASVWEMQIKLQLGKLKLSLPLATLVRGQQESNQIEVLPVELEHVLALQDLPNYHKDPFDRLLIAQARVEQAVVLSGDPIFERYPVQCRW
jgi:PIN domain nuclease of toxin-antitoxin system